MAERKLNSQLMSSLLNGMYENGAVVDQVEVMRAQTYTYAPTFNGVQYIWGNVNIPAEYPVIFVDGSLSDATYRIPSGSTCELTKKLIVMFEEGRTIFKNGDVEHIIYPDVIETPDAPKDEDVPIFINYTPEDQHIWDKVGLHCVTDKGETASDLFTLEDIQQIAKNELGKQITTRTQGGNAFLKTMEGMFMAPSTPQEEAEIAPAHSAEIHDFPQHGLPDTIARLPEGVSRTK